MKRLLFLLLVLLILTSAGYFIWKWYFVKNESIDAFKLIPADAVFVVQTDEPIEGWKALSKSAMWQHVKNYKPLGEVGKMADELSETINDNDMVFSAFGHRNLLISAHVIPGNDYDFLYVCDMEEGSKFSTVKDGILGLCESDGCTYTKKELHGIETHHFYDPEDSSMLHIAFVANQLICSYNSRIFDNALLRNSDSTQTEDPKFTEIASETASNGICRLFLNHKNAAGFLNVYMQDMSMVNGLFQSMHYTGSIAELDDNGLSFQGFTSINDSVGSYLRALYRSGHSNTNAPTVLSEKTAFMLSMGFQSFGKFYENLKDVMKQDPEAWKEFNTTKKTVERLLRFRLEEDLMGWVDDEVCVAQYHQERVIGAKVHTIAAIKALSEEKATEKLDMLKKRLALLGKFKARKYRDCEIHYVEVRGLFRLLFGKLFDKIQKPYYTVINGFVLFCDDPATLLHTIDDIRDGKTLAQNEDFKSFYSGFKKENSLLSYVNMKRYFLNLKGVLDAPSYTSSYANREYIICFPQMGFQFSKSDKFFDTRLRVQFAKPSEQDMEITEGRARSQEDLEAADSLSSADAFILEFISGSVKKEIYDNGNTKIVAETRDGVLNGKYIEYWENGTIKIKGRYKGGEKTGRWFYYTEGGELERRERFGTNRLGDSLDILN